MEKKLSIQQDSNPQLLCYEACVLPLCYNRCPAIKKMDTLIRFSSVSIFLSLSARVALSFDTSDSRVSADDRCGSGRREKPTVNTAALMSALLALLALPALPAPVAATTEDTS